MGFIGRGWRVNVADSGDEVEVTYGFLSFGVLVMAEVRYQYLRPGQARERRESYPVAYIPIGTLEWHGPHLPYGADGIQAEALAVRCAERGGGVVLPVLYYGESRNDSLMEAVAEDREAIAEGMGLPAENFLPGRQPFTSSEQAVNYHRLLWHVLAEAQSLGFKVGVLVAGHYPLIDHARAAVSQFHQWGYPKRRGKAMLAWAAVDYLLVKEKYPDAGDHAAGWETSHLLATHPELVDLGALPKRGEKLVGIGGKMLPHDATSSYGEEILDAAAEVMIREVGDRLAHPERYMGHGCAMLEGLWKRRGVI